MKLCALLTLPTLIPLVTGQALLNETWRQQKKVLISSHYGGYSHAKPIFQIATVLKQRGHEVTFASFSPFLDLAEPWGFDTLSMGDGPLSLADLKASAKEMLRNTPRDVLIVIGQMWGIAYSASYLSLTKILTQEKPDLVMCDVFNFGCIDAANDLGIPFSVQIPSLGVLRSKLGYVTIALDLEDIPKDSGILNRFQRNVVHRAEYIWKNWRFSQIANKERTRIGAATRKEFGFNNMDKGVIFVNSFFGMDKPKHLPPNVHLVGPLLSPEYPPLSPELESFLSINRRVVYVAFGTHMQLETNTIEKILTSLLHLINDQVIDGVIWPLSAVAAEEFPHEIRVHNSAIPTEQILNNQHPKIKILKFAPQFSILSHPNTVLFVSHGGLDSSNEALVTGTKILNIPTFGDHFYNAANLQASGVSIPLDLKTFTVSDMVQKATQLLEDKDGQFEGNVRRMQQLAHINSRRIQYAADVAEQLIYAGNTKDPAKSIYQTFESRLAFWQLYDLDILLILTSTLAGLIYVFFISFQWIVNTANPSIQSAKVKTI